LAADNKSHVGWVKGTLIGEDGKPFKGAIIRAEPKGKTDLKGKAFVTATDSRGQYLFTTMPIGDYSLTAYVDGVAMSRAIIRTSNQGWSNVNFDLRLNANGADGVDRMQRDIRFSSGTTEIGGVTSGP
ncbi:MAG TPA: carboxypeptidase-like regulatory domain-containing protein, partial [Chthoniobacterales bacterium]|nr:carboxypeptidase-like regulatory domain-containing protein [Chthoniobacterales bacterium]